MAIADYISIALGGVTMDYGLWIVKTLPLDSMSFFLSIPAAQNLRANFAQLTNHYP